MLAGLGERLVAWGCRAWQLPTAHGRRPVISPCKERTATLKMRGRLSQFAYLLPGFPTTFGHECTIYTTTPLLSPQNMRAIIFKPAEAAGEKKIAVTFYGRKRVTFRGLIQNFESAEAASGHP